MNIPSLFGQGPGACADYQSMYGARSSSTTFAQTIAQTQSSCLSLTTAEGDLVTFSDLSIYYQQSQGAGWFSPTSSGVSFSGNATSAEAMGFSVQGDLNEQELSDITRLVGELTSIASTFFSGDYESTMTKALDFGNIGLGSVSALSASFSSQTVTHTRITSHSPLPAMANLRGMNLPDLFGKSGAADGAEAKGYAKLLEARWEQILTALDTMREETLETMPAPRMEPLPADAADLTAEFAEETPAPVSGMLPISGEPDAADPASIPAPTRAARQMMAHMEQFLAEHPKLTPMAKALTALAMQKAVGRTDQGLPDTARAFGALQNGFHNQLHQWFLPPTPPPAEPLATA